MSFPWRSASARCKPRMACLFPAPFAISRSASGWKKRSRQSERELRQLIDVIPQQVYVFDEDWSPLFANEQEREYTGLTSERDAV